jgi:hypothetical protein
MADSDVDVCSAALQLLGAEAITALTDDSDRARLCARLYPKARREVLTAHAWNRCVARTTLAQASTAPTWGYSYAYPLPVACLRVLSTSLDRAEEGEGDAWDIEIDADGNASLLTDETSVSIRYIVDQTDVTKWSPALEKAIVQDLAAKLAFPLTQNRELRAEQEQLAARALSAAKGLDGTEQSKRRYVTTTLTRDVR